MTDNTDRSEQMGEAVAWILERPGNNGTVFPKLVFTEADADEWIKFVNVNPPVSKRPLYARTPSSPPAQAAPVSGEVASLSSAVGYAAALLDTHASKLPLPSLAKDLASRCREAADLLATPPAPASQVEAFLKDEFADRWDDVVEADYRLVSDAQAFYDECEKAGLAEFIPVDDETLDDPFACERGIERGGMMWSLTRSGIARYQSCRAALQAERPTPKG